MRKSFLLLAVCLFAVLQINAQETRLRGKYLNLSYGNMKVNDGREEFKSDLSVGLTHGRTYYLHKKPLVGMVRLGIDATWFDMNYTNYSISHQEGYGSTDIFREYDVHQLEIGMQVGPSVTVNPIGKLNMNGYFRYAPSFSGLYDVNRFMGNYATFFTAGGAVSYNVISVGVEARWGNCWYKRLFGGDDDDDNGMTYNYSVSGLNTNFSGYRAYISFRF